jgi:hypothetical protein
MEFPMTGPPRQRCSARSKQTGEQCKLSAIPGGTTCRFHGGAAPQVRAKAKEREMQRKALEAAERLGLGQGEVSIDPAEAMLAQVRKAAWNVAWYEAAIADLQARIGRVTFGEGVLEVPDTATDLLAAIDADNQAGPVEADSVVLFLPGKESDKIAPHTLVELYNAERDRLVKYSAECRRAGVEERRIEITAELGRQLVAVLRAATAGIFALVRGELEAGRLDVERLGVLEAVEVPALVAAEVARVRAEGSAA